MRQGCTLFFPDFLLVSTLSKIKLPILLSEQIQNSVDLEIPVQDRAGSLDHGIGERIGVLYVKPFFIQKMKQHFDHTAGQCIQHEPGIGIRGVFPESDVFFQFIFQDLTVFE